MNIDYPLIIVIIGLIALMWYLFNYGPSIRY